MTSAEEQWLIDHQDGFEWLLQRSVECEGSLLRILEVQAPGKSTEAWVTGFNAGFWALCELLVPSTVDANELEEFIGHHEPTEADAEAVRRFVEGEGLERLRRQLWGA